MKEKIRNKINNLETVIGIELGSTRVKSVLIDFDGKILASGSHTWENKLDENNYWTYSEDDIWESIRNSYGKLKEDVKDKYRLIEKDINSL